MASKPTPEQQKAIDKVRQDKYDAQQSEAAKKAPARNLGGALDIFKRKDTPIPEPVKRAKGGAVKKYAAGGAIKAALAKHAAKPASKAHAGLKKGGSVDGIAKRGKTKGTMVGMSGGGMTYRKGGMCK